MAMRSSQSSFHRRTDCKARWSRGWLLLSLCLVLPLRAEESVLTIDVKAVNQERQEGYYIDLLKRVLEASKAPHETIQYRFADYQFAQLRWVTELSRESPHNNGVLWTMTTQQREQMLRPIRKPLFEGLIGQRVLVIRRVDREKFARINTLEQLRELTAGQGVQWPDLDIFRANDLPVIEGNGKEQLYKMLAAKRFDYFPRGVMEIVSEQTLLDQYDLIVEPRLIISYPAAIYFFVNKHNHTLAQRLERGWEVMQASGEFQRFFYSHERVVHALRFLQSGQHHPIYLHNPLAPPGLQVKPLKDWLAPGRPWPKPAKP